MSNNIVFTKAYLRSTLLNFKTDRSSITAKNTTMKTFSLRSGIKPTVTAGALLLSCGLGLTSTAMAQQGGGGPPQITEEQRQQWEERARQRQEQAEKAKWEWVKQTFLASGFTDAAMHEAFVGYLQEREKSVKTLQEQARELTGLLIAPEPTNEEVKAALGAYRAAVAADKAKNTRKLGELEEQFQYSTKPRLETLLSVLGVVGSETEYLGGLGALIPESPFGNAGQGGGRGGRGGGGQGGRGGGGGQAPPAPNPN